MDDTELWHWKYRVDALNRAVENIQNIVAMASARREPKNHDELAELQVKYDHLIYLRAEADYMVATAS